MNTNLNFLKLADESAPIFIVLTWTKIEPEVLYYY